MQTVIFRREYRHNIDELRHAVYPPDVEISVTDAIAKAARKVRALKEEKKARGQRPAEGE